jgi:Tfp pilus assembly protein PilP
MREYTSVYLGKNSGRFRKFAKSKNISLSKLVREALVSYLQEMEK